MVIIDYDNSVKDGKGNNTNPNKFVFKFSSSPPSPAGDGIYENLLGLA
jgi:hypothetical protein